MMFRRFAVVILAFCLLSGLGAASATTLEVDPDAALWVRLGADILLYLHIGGGAVGMMSGPIAILSRKGHRLHRAAGKVFFVSMLTCYTVGTAVAPFLAEGQRPNFVAGVLALYLLLTSWRAATRRVLSIGPLDYAGLAVAVLVGASGALFMYQGANHPSGTVDGSPPDAFVIFVFVGVIAALEDLHLILRRSITEIARLSRHLWRMCMSLFIASGSFFFGQEQLLPDWVRGTLLQDIPVFFPLVAIVIWLVLVRVNRKKPALS